MPRLSDTMEEGVVAKWLKNVGDKVEEGEILAEIETDKATMEFESFHEGTLLHIGIQEGESAPVDALLAIIGAEGEDISGLLAEGGQSSGSPEPAQEQAPEPSSAPESAPEPEPARAMATIPEGVEVVRMPRLSDTMEEGTVAKWLKSVGDTVEEGDILAEIETDKATMEFESFYSGTLLHIGIQEGESAPVDAVLAIIGPEGTDVQGVLATAQGGGAQQQGSSGEETSEPAPVQSVQAGSGSTPVQDASAQSPVQPSEGGRIKASPLARKIASDKGLDLRSIAGTGDHGRIVKRDVENAQPVQPAATGSTGAVNVGMPAQKAVNFGTEGVEEVKNSQMRKVIAKRLSESKFTAPHYYLTVEVEMDSAKESRAQMNNLPNTKISFNDMVLKACAMALTKHPQVNTSWNVDTTVYHQHVHMGVAVAVDEGLVVPVIRHADRLNLSQIGTQVKDMAARARDKKLTPQEMEGSTFTVSNLGMFGITEFTSIINQPNSAILSVGAIVPTAVVREGEIVVRNMMKVTLACDHRTVDGATGAQFLQTVQSYLENPVTMLA